MADLTPCEACHGTGQHPTSADTTRACSRCGGHAKVARHLTINGHDTNPIPTNGRITYEQICELAGVNHDHNPTCTYRRAAPHDGQPIDGILTHGQTITIGMTTYIRIKEAT